MELLIGKKITTDDLRNLKIGETILVPCQDGIELAQRRVQSMKQRIQQQKPTSDIDFTQKKALIIIDEKHYPLPIVLVTRKK